MIAFSYRQIGRLLQNYNYLVNTKRGSAFYRIKWTTLRDYRWKLLDEYDEKHRNGDLNLDLLFKSSTNGVIDDEAQKLTEAKDRE